MQCPLYWNGYRISSISYQDHGFWLVCLHHFGVSVLILRLLCADCVCLLYANHTKRTWWIRNKLLTLQDCNWHLCVISSVKGLHVTRMTLWYSLMNQTQRHNPLWHIEIVCNIIIISLFTHCNKNNGTIKKEVNFTFQFKQMSFMTSSTSLLI